MDSLTKNIKHVAVFLFIFFSFVALSLSICTSGRAEQYSLLSEAFLKGKLYFTRLPVDMSDMVYYKGNYYWPNPILPAILLFPFTLILNPFGISTYQIYISIPIIVLLVVLLYKIFERFSSKEDSFFWIYGFMFSSCFLAAISIPWSWYIAHLLAVFLSFLAIHFYKQGKPMIIIGVIYGLIFLSRPTASLGIFYVLLSIIFKNKINFKSIIKNSRKIVTLFVPFLMAVIITLGYNYARFGTFKDLGYSQNNLLLKILEENRSYGIFSLNHVPGNFYYMFLSGPEPIYRNSGTKVLKFPYLKSDPWGMSMFLTSPYLLLLFTFNYKKNKETILLLVTSLIIMIPILLYFGIGFRQFGYRYSLDFFPYVYLAFVSGYTTKNRKVSNRLKILFMAVSLTNLFFFISVFS